MGPADEEVVADATDAETNILNGHAPFPTGDLTMIAVDLYNRQGSLNELKEGLFKTSDFTGRNEAIANIMLALRHIEDAEVRVLRAKEQILQSVIGPVSTPDVVPETKDAE